MLGVYAYDIDEYIIFCEGTVFDKELNYIGRLYNDKLVEIYCEDEKLACITYEKEYNEREYFFDGEICNVSNEVYLLYDKKSNLDGNSYKIEKSELDKRLKEKTSTDGITVYINNRKIEFDKDVISENDRCLVPMRAIFEALGAEVEWDEKKSMATATKDGTKISVTIDSDVIQKMMRKLNLMHRQD